MKIHAKNNHLKRFTSAHFPLCKSVYRKTLAAHVCLVFVVLPEYYLFFFHFFLLKATSLHAAARKTPGHELHVRAASSCFRNCGNDALILFFSFILRFPPLSFLFFYRRDSLTAKKFIRNTCTLCRRRKFFHLRMNGVAS